MDQQMVPGKLLALDVCLTGVGALAGNQFFHSEIPTRLAQKRDYNIAHLELMAVIVALRVWRDKFKGKRFCIQCDNMAVVQVINRGVARDKQLQGLLRLFTFEAATGEFEVVAEYLMGSLNRVPDILSRWHLSEEYHKQFEEVKESQWEEILITSEHWIMEEIW